MEVNFWKITVLIILQLFWTNGEARNQSDIEKKILQKIFMVSKFHMYIKPEQSFNETKDEPIQISVSLHIINTDIDVKKQECKIHMYFRQEWNDSRLAYDNQGQIDYLLIHEAVGFWTPDLFFVNENWGHHHTMTKPNTFVRIYPEGKVFYSQRLTLRLNCAMNLKKYPFDEQICKLPVESYGYSANDLMLKWEPNITFGNFESLIYKISYSMIESISNVGDNSYSHLELRIHFSRLIHTLLFHLYIPLTFLLFMSWIPFWIKPCNHLSRLAIATINIFSTLLFLQSTRELFYVEPYPTALDIWTGFSCLLIFSSAFENIYILINQANAEASAFNNQKNGSEFSKMNDIDQRKTEGVSKDKMAGKALNIDGISKIIFPSAFFLFNLIYLAYYLV